MIAEIIAPTIDAYRATKDDQFFYEFDVGPTDDEVDEFIKSSSCFDSEMKEFLLKEVEGLMILTSKNQMRLPKISYYF